jgi:DNA-binding response OmpR family regulator
LEKTPTILAIDSDATLLQFLDNILTSKGFHMVMASDGVHGLSLLRIMKVDLILLGITMPDLDGISVLKSIREFSYIPVIMVTGRKDVKTLEQALIFGADDYVTKPFKPDELLARIHAKLRRR